MELKVKVVGNNVENYISDQELVELICKSKIVLNFSKTTWNKLITIQRKIYFLININ